MIDPFPTNDHREFGYGVAKVTLGALPGLGGAAQELLDKLVGSPLQKRREEWFATIGLALADLSERLDDFDAEALAEDEVFVSTVARATQLALATHGKAKREALRNIVLNTARGVRLDEALLGSFLSYVERFSEAHLKLLALLANPMADAAYAAGARNTMMGSVNGIIVGAHPDLARDAEVFDRLHDDLARENLVNKSLKGMMSGSGLQNPQTTPYGEAFLEFIRQPPD